jgi:hypothetical protein
LGPGVVAEAYQTITANKGLTIPPFNAFIADATGNRACAPAITIGLVAVSHLVIAGRRQAGTCTAHEARAVRSDDAPAPLGARRTWAATIHVGLGTVAGIVKASISTRRARTATVHSLLPHPEDPIKARVQGVLIQTEDPTATGEARKQRSEQPQCGPCQFSRPRQFQHASLPYSNPATSDETASPPSVAAAGDHPAFRRRAQRLRRHEIEAIRDVAESDRRC